MKKAYLSKIVLWIMTLGSGLVVANLYYSQPLLAKIAKNFNINESDVSSLPMLTQIGYAVGLFLLIPLGDMLKRKKMIIIDFIFMIIFLLITAHTKSFTLLLISSFFVGITSVVPQFFISITAQLSSPSERGKNIGIVVSGLLIGILSSRILSGRVGDYWGWREMYMIAAYINFILWILIILFVPEIQPTFKGSYLHLMKSVFYYAKKYADLRLASVRGALAFGSFLIFWTALTFHLEKAPFYAGSREAGDLGIAGIVGALSASFIGRIAGKVNKYKLIIFGFSIMISSWIFMYFTGNTYWGLIIGIIFLDLGLQNIQITNQTIIFSLDPSATNRINTTFMTTYFIGGAFGTFVGGKVTQYSNWNGVVAAGIIFLIIALLLHIIFSKNKRKVITNNK